MADEIRGLPNGVDAPDFTLKDQHGNDFKLSDQRGKRVLLSFHPLAWTGVCAKQMQALEEHKKDFDALNTVAVGISVDSTPAKEAWAKDLGITETPMLADFWPHGEVSRRYNVFRQEDGLAQRSNILVDENGKIAFTRIYEMSQLPDFDEVIAGIKRLK